MSHDSCHMTEYDYDCMSMIGSLGLRQKKSFWFFFRVFFRINKHDKLI